MHREKMRRVPLNIFSFEWVTNKCRRYRSIGRLVSKLKPSLQEDLRRISAPVEFEFFAFGSFLSSLIYGLFFLIIGYVALTLRGEFEFNQNLGISIAIGFGLFFITLLIQLMYPKIILNKIAAKENKDLLYALREITMQVEGGVPLFQSLKNVSKADYGYVSKDFEQVIKKIESGEPDSHALKYLALKTESRYLKKALWQMIGTLESGSSMQVALPGIIDNLEEHLLREIKNYSASMNFLMLIYMLGAAAVPSVGITFLVLLSVFSDFGISIETIGFLVFGSAFIQIVLIAYMSITRPSIFEG